MKKSIQALITSIAFSGMISSVNAADNSEALHTKMNAYIDCYNGSSERAISSINRYESWVSNMDNGPTGKEKHIYGLYSLNGVENCKENVTAVLAIEPKQEKLDGAAKEYLDALLVLDQKVQEADKYYSRENYKDDNFAKGKEMHPALVVAMNAFLKANDQLSSEIRNITDSAQREQLAQMEAAGDKSLDYWMLALVVNSKDLLDLMSEDNFDTDKVTNLITQFEDANDGLIKYSEEHPDDWAKVDPLKRTAENFIIAAKERMRRVRDKTPYSKGEKMNLNPQSGWMVSGSPYKLLKAYNSLIDAVNR